MKIPVRPVYRVLGTLLSLFMLVVILALYISGDFKSQKEASVLTVSLFTFVPLILSSCIIGHVPYFLTKYIPEEMEDDLMNSEKIFTEFSWGNIIALISFLIVAGLMTYF